MQNKITGATAIINLDYNLMHNAGIHALRYGFGYPFHDTESNPSESFLAALKGGQELCKVGFTLLGSTFGPGSYRYDKEANCTRWISSIPESIDGYDSDTFYKAAEEAGEYLGRTCAEICEYWQVANEPDIDIFKGEMTDDQSVRFLLAVATGLKKGNPNGKPGINLGFMTPYSEWLLTKLYKAENTPFEYVRIERYFKE